MVSVLSFDNIERLIRRKTFGILSTVSTKGFSQSTGVLYGVSQSDEFCLYIYTYGSYRKTQNIKNNPKVSFVIPFPHHFFRFVPANTIAFQATAEIIPIDNLDANHAFRTHRVLKMMIDDSEPDSGTLFLKLRPGKRLHVYGLGNSILELRKSHETGNYDVEIPSNRRAS